LKATVRIAAISEDVDQSGAAGRGVIVQLNSKYRSGTADTRGLAHLLAMFLLVGNQQIKDVFEGPHGIIVWPHSPEVDESNSSTHVKALPPSLVKTAIAALASFREDPMGLFPFVFNICSPKSSISGAVPLVFLEGLHLMRIERGHSANGMIYVKHEQSAEILACARAVSARLAWRCLYGRTVG
jgi:hypothetical protein